MDIKKEPDFKVGDLVTGCYDYDDLVYYSIFGSVGHRSSPHVGVIVDVSTETFYFGEYIYTILCVDGNKRFFLQEELSRL